MHVAQVTHKIKLMCIATCTCVLAGPIVPAVLRTEGVVQLSGDLAATVDSGAELPPGVCT